jgi:hypothetical protein
MGRKVTKKGLDKKALKLWSLQVLDNAKNKCEICGKQESLSAHHYFGRKNKSTRYYVPNGVALCYQHHVGGVLSAHESPDWFCRYMKIKRGKKWHADLEKKWNETIKWDETYILAQINNLNL